MSILKQTSSQLVLQQFPIAMWLNYVIGVLGSLSLVFIPPIIEPDVPDINLLGYTFGSIGFVLVTGFGLLSEHTKVIIWNFDKKNQKLTVQSKGLFGTEITEYPLDEIASVALDTGFGGSPVKIELILADISRRRPRLGMNNYQTMKEAVEAISTFLNIPSKRKQ